MNYRKDDLFMVSTWSQGFAHIFGTSNKRGHFQSACVAAGPQAMNDPGLVLRGHEQAFDWTTDFIDLLIK
jgi:hypothetical protein